MLLRIYQFLLAFSDILFVLLALQLSRSMHMRHPFLQGLNPSLEIVHRVRPARLLHSCSHLSLALCRKYKPLAANPGQYSRR